MQETYSDSSKKVSLSWIALLRIMMGLVFLTSWASNLFQGFYTPEGLNRFFSEVYPQSENPIAFYAGFINGVILPIRGIFAPFQLVTELVMGLALLVGALTPFFSLVGIFFLVNTFLATFGHDWPWSYLMPITILAVVSFTRAGRVLGVDAFLFRRYGEKSLWL